VKSATANDQPFSDDLEGWLEQPGTKTIGDLTAAFGEKSFAIAFILLMFLSALPIPTGGITAVFEIITMLLALELIIGRTTLWLPRRWQRRPLGGATQKKAVPFVVRRIRWFERHSRPRLRHLLDQRLVRRLLGVFVLVFTLGSFVAPPFSGLDTLPAMGVILLALSIVLEDAMFALAGVVVGTCGIALEIALASTIVTLF
jgi:hypothetical protein